MPEALKKILLALIKLILIALGVWVLLKIGGYFVPFIVAFIFSSLMEPLVRFFEKRLHIGRKIGSVLSLLMVLGVIITILTLLITRLVTEIINFYNGLNLTMGGITTFVDGLIGEANNFFIGLPAEFAGYINNAVTDLTGNLENYLKPIVDIAQGTIKFAFSLPQTLVFILVTIIATYFMSSDKMAINKFLDRQIPSNWLRHTRPVLNQIFSALFGWIKTQFILVSVAVSEVIIGLLIIGFKFSLLIILLIAVIEFIPVLRAEAVIIPWAIISLISGDTRLGLSLLILDVIILVVRQLIEPKILGKQIGIHPLLTLFGVYLGLEILGIFGMILGPLCVMVIKCIMEGILKADGLKGWIDKNLRIKPKPSIEINHDK